MSQRRHRSARRSAPPDANARDPVRPWLLGGTTALLVARPFTPGVAVAQEGHGVVFVVLWLVLAVLWFAGRLRHASTRPQFDPLDAAVAILFSLYLLSGALAVGQASPRPALNMFWQWVAMGVGYFLVRQLVRSPGEQRALLLVMIGLAVGLAAIGIHQYYFAFPQSHAEYEMYKDDPETVYSQTGRWLPVDSPERKRFEDRLYSAEPYATFALANSLAGFLLPWFVLLMAIGLAPGGNRHLRIRFRVVTVILLLILAACLLLTKSRSAMLAAALGVGVCVAMSARAWLGAKLRLAASLLAVGLLVVAAGLALASFDRGLLSQAGKSMGYRLQYWQSTWQMIGDHPWWGCGPGQFQDSYTAYKLPAASEEIADPHNFLLEIWSTAGTPSALAMVAVLGLLAWSVRRALPGVANDPSDAEGGQGSPGQVAWIYGGAAVGLPLGAAAAVIAQQPVGALPWSLAALAVALTLMAGQPWVRGGALPSGGVVWAAGAMLVHLMAAGGISDPAMASSLWLLIALAPRRCRPATRPGSRSQLSWPTVSGLVIGVLALIAAYLTTYQPVLNCRTLLTEAASPQIRGRPASLYETVQAACEADRFSTEARRQLAALAFAAWQRETDTAALARMWQQAGDEAARLAPRSSRIRRENSQRFAELYEQVGDEGALARATTDAWRAVRRYPTEAEYRLHLADLLLHGAEVGQAQRQLRECLKLDDAKRRAGHEDKQLSSLQRQRAEQLLEDSRGGVRRPASVLPAGESN